MSNIIVRTRDGHFGQLLCIKGTTAYILEPNNNVWYCPKTDIIDDISEFDKDEKIADLEAKLAEKQSKIQELNDMYEDLLVAKGTENELMQVSADCDFFAKENRKLKQQLAEKEKEIEKITKIVAYKDDMDRSTIINGVKFTNEQIITLQNIDYFADKHNQDKISFAVEQLTQAIKNIKKCNYKDFGIIYQSDAIAVIDNQIKELKEMK